MRVAVLGGGAAGMMAAATLNELNGSIGVTLIEKNPDLGRKVLISGGGRCNVTTGKEDIRLILESYPRGDKFLNSAMRRFSPQAVYEWFENHGVPLKAEKDLRVFPISDNGKDIVKVFKNIFEAHSTQVLVNHEIADLQKTPHGSFKIEFKNHAPLEFDKVILTTGGQAYRQTGSTGEGYGFAEKQGHTITPLAGSLNAFVCQEAWPSTLAGVSLIQATLKTKRKERYHSTGPLLFTHKGITGPAVFALSSQVAFERYDREQPLEIFIDLMPHLKSLELEEQLKKQLTQHPSKEFRNTLSQWIPKSLTEVLCNQLQINEKNNAEVSKKELHHMLEMLKNLPLTVIGRTAGEEFVTAGGVNLDEINPQTMESQKCPGLYIAGEILNIDGFTGGYNLQAAWCTGRVAAEHLANLGPD